MIDERAIIHPSAKVADDVEIGPWTMIGPDVEIGPGTKIHSHVIIDKLTKIGANNIIFQYASIGADPQDRKYQNGNTTLEIGDDNIFREFCTIHRGTELGGDITRIGSHNLFMNYVHIAHDCIVGNHTTFSNNASLAGHVIVDDHANFGAFTGVRQFCHIGAHSFLGKGALIVKDVLPYVLVAGGLETKPYGINLVGLKRNNFSSEAISTLKRAYKIIFQQGLTVEDALLELETLVTECSEVQLLIDGIKRSEFGILR